MKSGAWTRLRTLEAAVIGMAWDEELLQAVTRATISAIAGQVHPVRRRDHLPRLRAETPVVAGR